MATKIICDGCGNEIPEWRPQAGVEKPVGDNLARALRISTGNNYQEWDLCDPCQGRVATALVELLPKTPRESWFDAIRPRRV